LIISKAGAARAVETELFENTLLICSSESTISAAGPPPLEVWRKTAGGYTVDYFPNYGDGSVSGGRLAMLYVPFKSQQPFAELNLEYSISASNSNSMLTCALNITPGKKNLQYTAIL
jgi:hypothetical protein